MNGPGWPSTCSATGSRSTSAPTWRCSAGWIAVVFTGGIGENAPVIREKVLEGLEHLGLAVDPVKNRNTSGSIAEIQPDGFPIKVLVIKTNEELEIARQTLRVIERGGGSCMAVHVRAVREPPLRRKTTTPVHPPERIRLFPNGGLLRDHGCTRQRMPVWKRRRRRYSFNRLREGGGDVLAMAWLNNIAYVTLDEWVVMPNHLHGILIIHDDKEECVIGRGGSRTAPTETVHRKPLGRLLGALKRCHPNK